MFQAHMDAYPLDSALPDAGMIPVFDICRRGWLRMKVERNAVLIRLGTMWV
jgi:hypothetical protein